MNWYSANDIYNSPPCDEAILRARLNVVLIAPEIAPNAGNISRLCYASGTNLHIIGKPGFDIKTDKHFKRAAIDYWDRLDIKRYADFSEFTSAIASEAAKSTDVSGGGSPRIILTSTNGRSLYFEFKYRPGDYIVFGPESSGIPGEVMEEHGGCSVRIPLNSGVRSLNLSTACGIIVFSAIAQIYQSSLI
jgi:tRNA (cytidine/uridine-2'-O-)-methyltransferase